MGSPTKACVPAWQDSFRLPPSSRPQTLNSSNTMAKGSGSKKAKKSGSNVFALFSQRQIQEFKEAFGIMDADKDGLLSSSDIVAAFGSVGKSISDGEAQGMLSEAPGPVNFTQMVMLFAEKMAGGADDDDTIIKALDAFEVNGKIDAEIVKIRISPRAEKELYQHLFLLASSYFSIFCLCQFFWKVVLLPSRIGHNNTISKQRKKKTEEIKILPYANFYYSTTLLTIL